MCTRKLAKIHNEAEDLKLKSKLIQEKNKSCFCLKERKKF